MAVGSDSVGGWQLAVGSLVGSVGEGVTASTQAKESVGWRVTATTQWIADKRVKGIRLRASRLR